VYLQFIKYIKKAGFKTSLTSNIVKNAINFYDEEKLMTVFHRDIPEIIMTHLIL
jgi:hypothetical protein